MKLKLVLKLAARDWKSGELRLLVVSILVAVGTVTAITMFVSRLQVAMEHESAAFLGADRVISSNEPIPETFRKEASSLNLQLSETVTFPTVVTSPRESARTQLASVKAVDSKYPLRGELRISEVPYGEHRPTNEVPPPGAVWLEPRLFPALNVEQGDYIGVGHTQLRVDRVLAVDPNRGGSMFDMAPRVIMRAEDLAATQVIQPGSRLDYRLLVAGDLTTLDTYFQAVKENLSRSVRWRDVRSTEARIRRSLDRAERFLLIGGSLAVLLAGVAIALSAHRYALRHFDHVGILKTLGATPNDVLWGYLLLLAVLGIAGIGAGIVVGTIAHFALVSMLQNFFPIELPPPTFSSLALGVATGGICLFAFALPPMLALKKISPLRVIRRDLPVERVSAVVTYGCAFTGSLALLVWYSGNIFLTFILLIGIVLVSTLFGIAALILLRSSRVVGMHAGSAFALAVAGLQRKYKQNVAQILIFGLAIMMLLILFLVRTTLIEEWRAQIPVDTPNHFLMNVTKEQVEGIESILAEHADSGGDLVSMISGRVSHVNETPVREYQRNFGYFGDGVRLSSGRQLTWMEELPERNSVVRGEPWTPESDESLVSVEVEYADDWGLDLGDELTFDIGGIERKVTISSVHSVEWESLNPNFFFIFSPGALADVPAMFMTSFHIPDENKPILTELIYKYPTVTLIDIDAIITQVQLIIDRVTQAVEWVMYLIIGSGALVLIASIQSSRDQRMKEHALIRTLGGTRKLVLGSLVTEFAVMGLIAGIVAACGAELTVYLVETHLLDMEHELRPEYWPIGPIAGALLIAAVGYFGTRKLVNVPPVRVLREL